jgi:hypothetical protein
VQDFISEEDLQTFEGWLRYQAVDASTTAPGELAMWRRLFEEARQRSAANPKVGLMKLQPVPGEHRYAVAVREGADLWLRMWVRRSRKGEFSSCDRSAIETGTLTPVTTSTVPCT